MDSNMGSKRKALCVKMQAISLQKTDDPSQGTDAFCLVNRIIWHEKYLMVSTY